MYGNILDAVLTKHGQAQRTAHGSPVWSHRAHLNMTYLHMFHWHKLIFYQVALWQKANERPLTYRSLAGLARRARSRPFADVNVDNFGGLLLEERARRGGNTERNGNKEKLDQR